MFGHKEMAWPGAQGSKWGNSVKLNGRASRASWEPSGPLRDYSDTTGQEHGALAWGSGSENRKKTEGH